MENNEMHQYLSPKENDSSAWAEISDKFGLTDNVGIKDVNITQLDENAHHPFKVCDDKKLRLLTEIIRKDGQMNPHNYPAAA